MSGSLSTSAAKETLGGWLELGSPSALNLLLLPCPSSRGSQAAAGSPQHLRPQDYPWESWLDSPATRLRAHVVDTELPACLIPLDNVRPMVSQEGLDTHTLPPPPPTCRSLELLKSHPETPKHDITLFSTAFPTPSLPGTARAGGTRHVGPALGK